MSAAFSDAWNPVLVKEVRAALRGRMFTILFPIVVFGGVLLALGQMAGADPHGSGVGRDVFAAVYIVMCVALFCIVPVSAFFSLGSEWEEHTYDLLSISDLRPRQVVIGKLLSAGIEALLYFSAFAPILVFAFLLRGIDVVAMIALLGSTLAASLSASALALALSSLVRARVARVLFLCVLSVGSIGLVILAANLTRYFVLRGRMDEEVLVVTLGVIVGAFLVGTTIACERLAHPEENHSTGPRFLVSLLFAAFLGVCAWVEWRAGSGVPDFAEPAMVGLFLVAIPHVFFTTEREDLSRRTAQHVAANPMLAILSVPFLPGGGRALFLFAGHVALALLATALVLPDDLGLTSYGHWRTRSEELQRVLAIGAWLFGFLALASWLAHRRSANLRSRWITRALIPLAFTLLVLGPSFLLFILGGYDAPPFSHALNPFRVLEHPSWRHGSWTEGVIVVTVVIALLNLGRIVRAVTETVRASHARRERGGAA